MKNSLAVLMKKEKKKKGIKNLLLKASLIRFIFFFLTAWCKYQGKGQGRTKIFAQKALINLNKSATISPQEKIKIN